jgi:hypothetical protein
MNGASCWANNWRYALRGQPIPRNSDVIHEFIPFFNVFPSKLVLRKQFILDILNGKITGLPKGNIPGFRKIPNLKD